MADQTQERAELSRTLREKAAAVSNWEFLEISHREELQYELEDGADALEAAEAECARLREALVITMASADGSCNCCGFENSHAESCEAAAALASPGTPGEERTLDAEF